MMIKRKARIWRWKMTRFDDTLDEHDLIKMGLAPWRFLFYFLSININMIWCGWDIGYIIPQESITRTDLNTFSWPQSNSPKSSVKVVVVLCGLEQFSVHKMMIIFWKKSNSEKHKDISVMLSVVLLLIQNSFWSLIYVSLMGSLY